MYWGLENSYFPDETALTIARQLALLGASAVIGNHPNAIQDHAYFGNTLVVFSPGRILSSTKVANYCWKKVRLVTILPVSIPTVIF
jgi:poly-gamma-glutamate capsule biosynthesis protein CapA/YwtB (metallophosphatase superfamily)